MASPTRWTWAWVNSGSWWWTGGLVCCSPRGYKESDMTEWLNWTETVCWKPKTYSADTGLYSQEYGVPSGHLRLQELDCKDDRMPKYWCLETMVPEKTPESPLDSKEIKPGNLKGSQPWMLSGRTDDEAEVPVFWSSDVYSRVIGKSLMLERVRAEGEKVVRGWDCWMASWMQWTWTWANFRRW